MLDSASELRSETAQTVQPVKMRESEVNSGIEKRFPGEVADSFESLFARLEAPKRFSRWPSKLVVLLAQPLIGALSHESKKRFEQAVGDRRIFSAEAATGLNVLADLLLYPLLLGAIGALGLGKSIFSQDLHFLFFFGLIAGMMEAAIRLREAILSAKPIGETRLRPSFYGLFFSMGLRFALPSTRKVLRGIPVPVDGFYSEKFVGKRERERRYGTAYTLEDCGSAYLLRFEFPRRLPPVRLKDDPGLGDEMPDYDFHLSLVDGDLVIRGRCLDDRVRKLAIQLASFPLEFTSRIQVQSKIRGFKHRYHNKLLEVILLKN